MENVKCMCKMCTHKCMKNAVMIFAIIIALFFVVKIAKDMKTFSYIGKDAAKNSITVSGKGEVVVKPDLATVTFSLTEENMDVSKASDNVNNKMSLIIKTLKASGIDDKDIKTTYYNINPRYDYINNRVDGMMYPSYVNGTRVLAGYDVSQGVEVKIRDLSKAGKIISDLGTMKVTDLSGLSFTNDKYDDLVKQAREDAIKKAREEAKKLAKSLGVDLGDIIAFSDGGNYPIYYAKDTMRSSVAGMGVAEAVLPTGENTITSNVSITYEIK